MKIHSGNLHAPLCGIFGPDMGCQPEYIAIKICDDSEAIATDDDQKITLNISNNATLMEFGSGNPKPDYNFNENIAKTFNGRALAVIKRHHPKDAVVVTVEAENGLSATCIL